MAGRADFQRYRTDAGQSAGFYLSCRLLPWGNYSVAPPPVALGLDRLGTGEISRSLAANYSFRHIAAVLGRAPSTVMREVARHGGREGYRAAVAEARAWEHGRRPKVCRLAKQPRLRRLVAHKLRRDWSPEQIAGWLQRHFPNDSLMRVSHETIYRSLFIQARGVLKKELTVN